MGNSPVTLDFSKAQPISPTASGSGIALDFSKAQPLPDKNVALPDGRVVAFPGSMADGDIAAVIKTQLTEQARHRTFLNMTAAMSGQPMQNAEDQAQFGQGRQAGTISGAATLAAGTLGGVLTAPAVTASTVGTGILDATGAEITKDVTALGPSLAKTGVSIAVNAIRAHPYISTFIATHLANALGVPLPKVLKAIALIPENQ